MLLQVNLFRRILIRNDQTHLGFSRRLFHIHRRGKLLAYPLLKTEDLPSGLLPYVDCVFLFLADII